VVVENGYIYIADWGCGLQIFEGPTGISEGRGELVASEELAPTLVRATLHLAGDSPGQLFDSNGRRVAQLAPGANDIRHLGPGVYFVAGETARPARVVVAR